MILQVRCVHVQAPLNADERQIIRNRKAADIEKSVVVGA
jgi:hypothetical protein